MLFTSAAVDSEGGGGRDSPAVMSFQERTAEKLAKGRQDAADKIAKTRQDAADKIANSIAVFRDRLHRVPADAKRTLATLQDTLVGFMQDRLHAVILSASTKQAGVLFFLASIGYMAWLRRRCRIARLSAQHKTYTGSCHCGQVRFRVRAPRHLVAWDCNCSICRLKKNVHFCVPLEDFQLLQSGERLEQDFEQDAPSQVPAVGAEEDEGGDVQNARYCGALTEYRFNTGVARHVFCSRCGVTAFYHPRSNPDGIGVTLACVPFEQVESHEVRRFDGENWEKFLGSSGIQGFSKGT